jgi:WD40 repeat protein
VFSPSFFSVNCSSHAVWLSAHSIYISYLSDDIDSVLDMHLCEELKLGACATADGGAALFDMTDGQFFVGIMPFGASVAARSVLIMRRRMGMGHAVVCGGSDGTIHVLPLNIDPNTGTIDREDPFVLSDGHDTAIRPKHVGPVMCMTSPGDGRFVSGGQDGALRIWDCSEADDGKIETKCMYALTGYKLWLGSAWTDGKRLISDGGENTIVIRDFSRERPGTN